MSIFTKLLTKNYYLVGSTTDENLAIVVEENEGKMFLACTCGEGPKQCPSSVAVRPFIESMFLGRMDIGCIPRLVGFQMRDGVGDTELHEFFRQNNGKAVDLKGLANESSAQEALLKRKLSETKKWYANEIWRAELRREAAGSELKEVESELEKFLASKS